MSHGVYSRVVEPAELHERGFVIVPELLSADDVAAAERMLDVIVDDFAGRLRADDPEVETQLQRVDGHELTSLHLAHARVLLQCEPDCDPRAVPGEALRVRKIDNLEDSNGLFDNEYFATKAKDAVLRLLETDLILFNSMAMFKPAGGGMEMPWHQDPAYLTFSPPSCVLVVWIALDAARAENGCLKFLRGGHHLGPLTHYSPRITVAGPGKTVVVAGGIVPAMLPDLPVEQAEVNPGDAVVFFSMVPHATARNDSACDRRSLQYHLLLPGVRRLSKGEFERAHPQFWAPQGSAAKA